jgi:RNA polymerase sigma factor (sigma-70 family)
MQSPDEAERQKGWEAWFKRDAATLLMFVHRRCYAMNCPEYSQDIVQDSFIKGFENISVKRYQDRGKPLQAYLYGIAKNLIYGLFRLQMKEVNDEEYLHSLADKMIEIENKVVLNEVEDLVKAACDRQPYQQRQVIEGLYTQGKSSKALAEELNQTASNTRIIGHRTIEAIQRDLEHRHDLNLSTDTIRACIRNS